MRTLSVAAHLAHERRAESGLQPTPVWAQPQPCLGWDGPCGRLATAHAHRMCVSCATEAAYAYAYDSAYTLERCDSVCCTHDLDWEVEEAYYARAKARDAMEEMAGA